MPSYKTSWSDAVKFTAFKSVKESTPTWMQSRMRASSTSCEAEFLQLVDASYASDPEDGFDCSSSHLAGRASRVSQRRPALWCCFPVVSSAVSCIVLMIFTRMLDKEELSQCWNREMCGWFSCALIMPFSLLPHCFHFGCTIECYFGTLHQCYSHATDCWDWRNAYWI